MLVIDCPNCGARDENEFHYGGEAHVPYPQDPYALSDKEWAEFLFYRANTKGIFAERWQHSAGCRKWFNAIRDTRTYEFHSTYRIGESSGLTDATGAPAELGHATEPDQLHKNTADALANTEAADAATTPPHTAGAQQ